MTTEKRCEQNSTTNAKTDQIRKFPPSSDLLLIAHDEWKRREERKHIHDEIPWIHGWISGFLTSDEFVQKHLKELKLGRDLNDHP